MTYQRSATEIKWNSLQCVLSTATVKLPLTTSGGCSGASSARGVVASAFGINQALKVMVHVSIFRKKKNEHHWHQESPSKIVFSFFSNIFTTAAAHLRLAVILAHFDSWRVQRLKKKKKTRLKKLLSGYCWLVLERLVISLSPTLLRESAFLKPQHRTPFPASRPSPLLPAQQRSKLYGWWTCAHR